VFPQEEGFRDQVGDLMGFSSFRKRNVAFRTKITKLWALFLCGTFIGHCAGPLGYRIYLNSRGERIMEGKASEEVLMKEFPAFRTVYEVYQPDPLIVEELRRLEKDVRVLVVLGTWCPDSIREVPRFLKALSQAQNPRIRVELIGVGRSREERKKWVGGYDIKRIPTFIVFYKGREIGRIVERPVSERVEGDFLQILQQIP